MSEHFGAIELPLIAPASGTAGDTALDIVAEAFTTILNARGVVGWQSVAPGRLPVVRAFTHNPEEMVFSESNLPALYVWRTKGTNERMAEDWVKATDELTCLWVLPTAQQETKRRRNGIANGLYKLIVAFLVKQADPIWVASADRAIADAIKTPFSTSTSATSYSTAEFNGVVGARQIISPRHITVTTAATGAYIAGSTITVEGLDAAGNPIADTLTLTTANGGETVVSAVFFSRVTLVTIAAQALTTGTFKIGHDADAAALIEGSNLAVQAGLMSLEFKSWKDRVLSIRMGDASPTRTYEALEMIFEVEERWTQEDTDFDALGGVDIDYSRSDGSLYEQDALNS